MVTIAVDAMGGDKAPVPGSRRRDTRGAGVRPSRPPGGRWPVVERELASHAVSQDLPIEVMHASERITMDDHAAKAARGKKDSSMHVCARLVDGQGGRVSFSRQYRRMHGHREDGLRQGSGCRSAGAFGCFSHATKARPWWWSTSARMWIAKPQCCSSSG